MRMAYLLVLASLLVSVAARGQNPETVSWLNADNWRTESEEIIGLERGEIQPSELPATVSDAEAPAKGEPAAEGGGFWRERIQRRYGLTARPHRGWWPSQSVGRSVPFYHPGIDGVDQHLVREEMLQVFTGIDRADTYLSLLRIFNIKLYARELVRENEFFALPINAEGHLAVVLTDGEKRSAASFLMRESDEHQGVFFLDNPQLAMQKLGQGLGELGRGELFQNSRPRLVFESLTGVLPRERPFTPAYSIRLGEIPVETGTRFHHYQPHERSKRRRLNMHGWFLR